MTHLRFTTVGFDLDGTLLDTGADLGAALNHTLALAGRPPVPLSHVATLIGGGARLMLKRALAETGGGVSDDELRRLHAELLRYYEANIAVHTRLYPGGAAMLDALAERGCTLAVVTNKFEGLAVKLLRELDLLGRLATVIGGDTLGPGRAKPAPDLLDLMVQRCGGGAAAFVGDTSYDVLAARAARIPVVAVSFGFNDRPAHELGADAVIGHFDELLDVLQRL
jgi:phosphoglycolate phosphatase